MAMGRTHPFRFVRRFFCLPDCLVPHWKSSPALFGKGLFMYYNTKESGKRLQALRKEHGMTQVQLAEALNISLDHLRKIEGGQRGCSVDLLIVLSDTFGVSLDFLVLGRGGNVSETKDRLQSLIDGLAALKESL